MTQVRGSGGRRIAASLGAAAYLVTASIALAATGDDATTAEAQASVVVVEPVGAGFAFDVLNDAVSAVFLNGEIGDSVSLIMGPAQSGPRSVRKAVRGVVVMASGVYRIDLLTPTGSRMGPLRSGSLSAGVAFGSSILFLAQFN